MRLRSTFVATMAAGFVLAGGGIVVAAPAGGPEQATELLHGALQLAQQTASEAAGLLGAPVQELAAAPQ
ncbi:hypothetical protein EIL87_21105 [Saccharopolyspora rhizosphaerae]|uniref:Uncharacterized protein n=1 Tax=Saccharopolyspora rhizosphaerae TaxID=2492662 RepID=A0A3R8VBT2_9PSEU|nr:hypothetical protein [Saccharopolyspora rhizosphaerae]RRO14238.1 hypothetical protein EIL87_21105 [Saccharopolyspora rhizosphaerae]